MKSREIKRLVLFCYVPINATFEHKPGVCVLREEKLRSGSRETQQLGEKQINFPIGTLLLYNLEGITEVPSKLEGSFGTRKGNRSKLWSPLLKDRSLRLLGFIQK